MNSRNAAGLFTRYVGLELKGTITARGFTAKHVAEETGHTPASMNRWLNGKVDLPLGVLFEACDVIKVEPFVLIVAATERVRSETSSPLRVVEPDVVGPPDTETQPLAAKRGERKADTPPAN